MRVSNLIKSSVALALVSTFAIIAYAGLPHVDRRVAVNNATEKKIAKVLVSLDGETYSPVSLPNGIKPGADGGGGVGAKRVRLQLDPKGSIRRLQHLATSGERLGPGLRFCDSFLRGGLFSERRLWPGLFRM